MRCLPSAVGDDEGGPPLLQGLEGVLHEGLALRIEGRGRLVEDL